MASRLTLSMLALVLLAGCSTLPYSRDPIRGHLDAAGEAAACATFLRTFDSQVAGAGVVDAQAVPVPGFPYLRSSRFLASFRETPLEGSQWRDWLQALRQLGRRGQQVELANLPGSAATWQALGVPDRAAAGERLNDCGRRLMSLDSGQPRNRDRLRRASAVPDAYADGLRVLGLYPLTALAVRAGVAGLYGDIRATFATAAGDLPVRGELTDYHPPQMPRPPATIPDWYSTVPRSGLGVRQFSGQQLEQLFHRHAPVWRIDVAQEADRIGAPYWTADSKVAIDTARPVVYRKTSYTRWRGETLLQLNYTIWFPARPLTGVLDLLGGHLDGITWRVTLDGQGEPLLYDAMHNCGCYHMAFPVSGLKSRENGGPWSEPLLVPERAPGVGSGERLRIRLQQGSHYLQALEAVEPDPAAVLTYVYREYGTLRSLPGRDGRRSLFDAQGLVPGTERRERWLLWPMGVPEPGAMRQWGTHATAFVGKRHFDDPDLIGRYFTAAPESAGR